jgi:hypothetical protein
MTCVVNFKRAFSGPYLGDWLGTLTPTWRRRQPLIVGIAKLGDEHGHWIVTWGPCICDSLSEGKWLPLAGSRHLRAFVGHVWTITPAPVACGPVKLG